MAKYEKNRCFCGGKLRQFIVSKVEFRDDQNVKWRQNIVADRCSDCGHTSESYEGQLFHMGSFFDFLSLIKKKK